MELNSFFEEENSLDEFIWGETNGILNDVCDLVDEAYYKEKSIDYLVECCRIAMDKVITLHWFRCDPGEAEIVRPPDHPPEQSAPDSLCAKLIPVTMQKSAKVTPYNPSPYEAEFCRSLKEGYTKKDAKLIPVTIQKSEVTPYNPSPYEAELCRSLKEGHTKKDSEAKLIPVTMQKSEVTPYNPSPYEAELKEGHTKKNIKVKTDVTLKEI